MAAHHWRRGCHSPQGGTSRSAAYGRTDPAPAGDDDRLRAFDLQYAVEVAAKSAAVVEGLSSLKWLLFGGGEIHNQAVPRFRAPPPQGGASNTHRPTDVATGQKLS